MCSVNFSPLTPVEFNEPNLASSPSTTANDPELNASAIFWLDTLETLASDTRSNDAVVRYTSTGCPFACHNLKVSNASLDEMSLICELPHFGQRPRFFWRDGF